MPPDEIEQIKPLLRDYVLNSSRSIELQWDPQIKTLPLHFHPYSAYERERSAHYFLMVAAVDTAELVEQAENARALMISIHDAMGDECFKPGQEDIFQIIVQKVDTYHQLGPSKEKIPKVLDSVNRFVHDTAKGNLVKYARKFQKPEEMVKNIGENVPYIGGQFIDHSRMYMRWMVRPFPELHIFNNFSPKDLELSMTSFMRNVAFCLGFCSSLQPNWSDLKRIDEERKQFTRFARELFPEDPAIVDYPFYVLGRWIRDEKLNLQLLKSHLQFWQRIYAEIGRPPIAFDVVSRDESKIEQNIRSELEKLKFIFHFEPHVFSLLKYKGAPQYRPDFVLPRCLKDGKIVILEPHGIWTPLQKRMVSLGLNTFPIWVPPANIEVDESLFVRKLRDFRKIYRDMYYLILLVPSSAKERIEKVYPDIYDEIFEDKDIPKMLYELKKNME